MIPPTLIIAAIFASVVGTLVALSLVVCLGSERLRRGAESPGEINTRIREATPYAAVLAAVLSINKGLQETIWALSAAIGYETTGFFYRVEGEFVAGLQAAIPDVTATYFSFVYMFGYGLVLVCPLALYLFAASPRPIKTLLAAYTINYSVAVIVYTLVIARGPRLAVGGTEGVIQEAFPYFTLLTGQVNQPTNVFPSLHTSMSVTVLILAVLTRKQFPRWLPIATVLTGSIVLSTMYLGIHWLTDVVAGVVLAVGAVGLSVRLVAERSKTEPVDVTRIPGRRS